MAHSRGFSPRSRTQRRRVEWNAGTGGTGLTSGAASGSQFLGATNVPAVGGLTIIRTRGMFDIFLDGPGATDGDGFFGAMGVGIATDAAIAAGITGVPTPITEQSWDGWLYHHFFSIHQGDVSALSGNPSMHQRIEVDSKAMRKLPSDMTMYAAIEVVEIGAATFNAFWDSRVLVKLP